MVDDPVGEMLEREKIFKLIKDKKKDLRFVYLSVTSAFELLHPNTPLKMKIIAPIMWEIIKWHPQIFSMYYSNNDILGTEKWKFYGDPVSERIIEEILKNIEADTGEFKIKYQR